MEDKKTKLEEKKAKIEEEKARMKRAFSWGHDYCTEEEYNLHNQMYPDRHDQPFGVMIVEGIPVYFPVEENDPRNRLEETLKFYESEIKKFDFSTEPNIGKAGFAISEIASYSSRNSTIREYRAIADLQQYACRDISDFSGYTYRGMVKTLCERGIVSAAKRLRKGIFWHFPTKTGEIIIPAPIAFYIDDELEKEILK